MEETENIRLALNFKEKNTILINKNKYINMLQVHIIQGNEIMHKKKRKRDGLKMAA